MTNPQNVDPDGPNPPQFNSLDASTTVVSVTIGGNDIGFSEVVESCITYNPFSSPCKSKYASGGKDQLAERIAATAPKVAAVLQGIHSRAPAAKIFVVNYPAIFPETGNGCWPQMPVSFGDAPYLRATEQKLNAMLATQAAANGATAGQLVRGQHRPRRLQGHLDPLGRTAGARHARGAGPSQQTGHGGRSQRAGLGGEIVLRCVSRASSRRRPRCCSRSVSAATWSR